MITVGPQAQAIIARDEAIMSTSFTREYPLVVDRAEGSKVWDVDNQRYLDFMAGIGVLNVGHRHPRVMAAVHRQIDQFWHVCLSDFYYPQAVELAEKLHQTSPMREATRYYFGNSGTEAVEAAVKLAIHHTGRNKFIGFLGGFHGRTLGSLAFTASKAVQSGRYPAALDVHHVPYPDPYRPRLVPYNGESHGQTVVSYLESELFRVKVDPQDVAAILVEPIQGEGGYIVPDANFLPALRTLCDRYGILLIVDEIQSGVGRTGQWWGIEHDAVEPDIICFAKGIASGLPLGGIMAKESVMSWEPGSHGSTFGGNPVAMAAALATLEVIEEENLLTKATETGQYMQDALNEMQERHWSMGEVRGRGLMIGVEIVEDQQTKKRAKALRDDIIQRAFYQGLLILPCGENAVRFIPPLNTPHTLIEEGLHLFEDALTESEKAYR